MSEPLLHDEVDDDTSQATPHPKPSSKPSFSDPTGVVEAAIAENWEGLGIFVLFSILGFVLLTFANSAMFPSTVQVPTMYSASKSSYEDGLRVQIAPRALLPDPHTVAVLVQVLTNTSDGARCHSFAWGAVDRLDESTYEGSGPESLHGDDDNYEGWVDESVFEVVTSKPMDDDTEGIMSHGTQKKGAIELATTPKSPLVVFPMVGRSELVVVCDGGNAWLQVEAIATVSNLYGFLGAVHASTLKKRATSSVARIGVMKPGTRVDINLETRADVFDSGTVSSSTSSLSTISTTTCPSRSTSPSPSSPPPFPPLAPPHCGPHSLLSNASMIRVSTPDATQVAVQVQVGGWGGVIGSAVGLLSGLLGVGRVVVPVLADRLRSFTTLFPSPMASNFIILSSSLIATAVTIIAISLGVGYMELELRNGIPPYFLFHIFSAACFTLATILGMIFHLTTLPLYATASFSFASLSLLPAYISLTPIYFLPRATAYFLPPLLFGVVSAIVATTNTYKTKPRQQMDTV